MLPRNHPYRKRLGTLGGRFSPNVVKTARPNSKRLERGGGMDIVKALPNQNKMSLWTDIRECCKKNYEAIELPQEAPP